MRGTAKKDQIDRIIDDFLEKYGPLISGAQLVKVLGYQSDAAFRKALQRKLVPVNIFRIENRRGYFARCDDVAAWLASLGSGESNID